MMSAAFVSAVWAAASAVDATLPSLANLSASGSSAISATAGRGDLVSFCNVSLRARAALNVAFDSSPSPVTLSAIFCRAPARFSAAATSCALSAAVLAGSGMYCWRASARSAMSPCARFLAASDRFRASSISPSWKIPLRIPVRSAGVALSSTWKSPWGRATADLKTR